MRHGLLTKYVDACRTSVALVGDYSPRTERILPRQNPFGKYKLLSAFGPVDSETLSFGLDRTYTQMLFDQRLILQEAVRNQAKFATVFQMFGRFSQQVLRCEIVGVHPDMERRIAQDRTQPHGRGVDTVTGNHLGFQTIGRQGQTTAGSGKGIHIQQSDLVVRVTTFHRRAQDPCTAAEVQQVTARQFVQVFQQQRAAAIQTTMAEHPRQADDLQRAFGQWQFVRLRQAFQRFGFRRVGYGDQPELAVPRAIEFAWLAERIELFGSTFDAAFFSPTRYSSRPASREARALRM